MVTSNEISYRVGGGWWWLAGQLPMHCSRHERVETDAGKKFVHSSIRLDVRMLFALLVAAVAGHHVMYGPERARAFVKTDTMTSAGCCCRPTGPLSKATAG